MMRNLNGEGEKKTLIFTKSQNFHQYLKKQNNNNLREVSYFTLKVENKLLSLTLRVYLSKIFTLCWLQLIV